MSQNTKPEAINKEKTTTTESPPGNGQQPSWKMGEPATTATACEQTTARIQNVSNKQRPYNIRTISSPNHRESGPLILTRLFTLDSVDGLGVFSLQQQSHRQPQSSRIGGLNTFYWPNYSPSNLLMGLGCSYQHAAIKLGLVARKPVFGVFDKARLK